MKKVVLLLICLPSISIALFSQGNKLTDVAGHLFKNVKTKLTVAEKNSIAKQLGFVLSGNSDQPFAQDKDSKDYPFPVFLYPTDVNKDGKEEIFVGFGNSYTSGAAESSIVVFVKNAKGEYASQLGFPGMMPDILSNVNKGYPDLLIGGPGMEFPVWRWDGNNYSFNRQVKDSDYGKLKKMSVEDVSKTYQLTLNQ